MRVSRTKSRLKASGNIRNSVISSARSVHCLQRPVKEMHVRVNLKRAISHQNRQNEVNRPCVEM
jgi:hypothetical protein